MKKSLITPAKQVSSSKSTSGIMQNVKKNEVYWSNFKGQNQKE